jgi:heme exporter protein D
MWNEFMQMGAPAAFAIVGCFGAITVAAIGAAVNRRVKQQQELSHRVEMTKITRTLPPPAVIDN